MEKAEMMPQYLLEIARDTLEGVEYCFLITLNKSGQANARLVQHFKPEAELTPEPFGLRPAALARAEESWVLEGRGDFPC